MTGTSHIRNGIGTVRPYVYGSLATWELVQAVFSPRVMEEHSFSENAKHIEAQIGDSVLVLEVSDPPYPDGFPGSVYVYVEDVDAAYQSALAVGAQSIAAPEDKPYGERQCGVRDAFGNVWWISTLIQDG